MKKGFILLFTLVCILVLSSILIFRYEMLSFQKKHNQNMKQRILNEVKNFNPLISRNLDNEN